MSGVARAMVFDGPGKPLRPVEVPLPVPGPGEVLVRVEMCTLCGSDLHTYFGRREGPTPCVLGHEIVGRVEAFTPESGWPETFLGEPLAIGDRVVWSLTTSCSECFYCKRQLPQKCENGSKYGHTPIARGGELGGGLATHCLLRPGTAAFVVPNGLPLAAAAPASCATATVVAASRVSGDPVDATVLILGAGMLGLTACAYAKAGWSAPVIVADPDPTRHARAVRFGADRVVDPADLTAAINDMTSGHGVDIAIELSGATAAVAAGLAHLRVGGRLILVGSVFPGPPMPVEPHDVVRRHLSIHGVHNYHPNDLDDALGFLTFNHKRHPFADLVSATFPLDRADDAFRAAATGEHVRVAVVP